MQNPNFDTIMKQADMLLESAAKELQNSEEDFVTFKACNNSRESILKYLTSFLNRHHVKPEEPATLAGLLSQCKKVDKRFDEIDMSCLLCRHDSEYDDYCLETDKVRPCLKVAEQTRKIVLADFQS